MTPAERAADKILAEIILHPTCSDEGMIKRIAAIITAHCGDGEDKERLDWLGNKCVVNAWLPNGDLAFSWGHHEIRNIRAAIDAARKAK